VAKLALSEIAQILKAPFIPSGEDPLITRLLFDSRQAAQTDGSLFFALNGTNRNGHVFVDDLYQRGVRAFVVEQVPDHAANDAHFLKVDNSLEALQSLAAAVRQKHGVKVLAITGSNGKTVVKEWLAQLLGQQVKFIRSPKSYNSQIGVPLSLWGIEAHHQWALIEAGISKPDEMARLQKIIEPTLGLFTNIGSAHAEFFASTSEKIKEKLQLFKTAKALVVQQNASALFAQIQAFAQKNGTELLTWSFTEKQAQLYAEPKSEHDFWLHWQGQRYPLSLPFADEASQQNALHSLRAALAIGLSIESLLKKIRALQPVEMRLEMRKGHSQNLIINDAYNSDLESLRIALHFLKYHGRQQPKVLIISDLLQTGLKGKALFQKMQGYLNAHELEQIIAIGPQLFKHRPNFKAPTIYFNSTDSFLKEMSSLDFSHKAILLKGARRFQFEKISQRLEQKSHETVLNIYLPRLVSNLNHYRAKLSQDTGIMAMVKAFSYGSGSYEIANLLQFHGVNYLGVAYADEGVELRKKGISLPILVLNPERNALPEMIDYCLEPEIYSFTRLEELLEVLKEKPMLKPWPIHLKLETGMNRLGFTKDELPRLVQILENSNLVKVESVFSHLAAADQVSERAFTETQIQRFEAMTTYLREELAQPFWRHLCNSAGISHYPQAHYDMVRLGISLYGVATSAADEPYLKVVSELRSVVSQLKTLQAGDSVSYGRTFTASQNMTIAIVGLGYADGFRRSLSNGKGQVVIRGKRYPTVGRVCMDMIMVDVTNSEVQEGDAVEIFGEQMPVQEVAQRMDTIPYEVFTGVGQRVKRIYFME